MTDILTVNLFIIVFAIAFAIYAGILAFYIMIRVKRSPLTDDEKDKKQKFYRAIKSGLVTNTVVTLNDVENVYKGIIGGTLEGNYQKNLNLWLRELNVDIISKNPILNIESDKDIEFKLDPDLIRHYKELLEGFIKELDEKAPFTELPDAERYLLNDLLNTTCQNEEQKKIINPKLLELAGLIKGRFDDLDNQKTINTITIISTIIGLVLTVFFGVASLK